MSITILSAPKSGLWRVFCNELGLESRTLDAAKLTDDVLAETRLLILPGVFSLPTGSIAKLRAFVDGGGRLLVTDRLPAGVAVVNLAPADLRKEGAAFDLAIALCVLAGFGCSYAAGAIPALQGLSSGMRTILLTVGLSALAALFFPVKEAETDEE